MWNVSGLNAISLGRRTARLIDIRTAICRSQPPNRAGSRNWRSFRIAWTKTSCVTSRASARCRSRAITVAKTVVSNCCTSLPNASRLPAWASITNPIVRSSSMVLGSRIWERPDALLKPPGCFFRKGLCHAAVGRSKGFASRRLLPRVAHAGAQVVCPQGRENGTTWKRTDQTEIAGQPGPGEPSVRSKPKTTVERSRPAGGTRTCRPSWKGLS